MSQSFFVVLTFFIGMNLSQKANFRANDSEIDFAWGKFYKSLLRLIITIEFNVAHIIFFGLGPRAESRALNDNK